VTLFVAQAGSLKRQQASQVAGLAAVTIAGMALVGWWASLPWLSGWGSAAMKPMTALSLATLGLALTHPGRTSRFAFALALAAVAIAALDFGISRGLLPPVVVLAVDDDSFHSGPGMPLATAIAGSALALSRFERHDFIAIMLCGLAGIIAVYALVAYLAGIESLRGTVRSPGLPTAVSMLCIAAGIILRIGMIPALRKSRPLRHLLTVLTCAIIVPLLLLAVYTGFRITDAQLEQTRKDLMNEAHTLSAEVDHEINGEIERLQALAASPSLRRGDFAEFQRQAEAPLALRQSGNVMLVDSNMRQVVNTWVPFGTPMPKAIVQEPMEKALATGKPQVTGLFIGPVSRQLLFSIIVPVQIDDGNRYALVRSPNRQAFASLLSAHVLPPGWQAAVADATHRIIARSGQEDGLIGTQLPPAQWHRASAGGAFEFVDFEGRPSLQAYAVSDLTGWETVVWEPKALAEAPVRALWWTISLTALLAFTLVVGLALWLGRTIARSVGLAARAAAAVGEGSPLSLSGTPVAEVNTLMAELRGAAARRQAAEQDLQVSKDQLQVSKDRLQLAFDATQLGWWQDDPHRGVGWGDSRFNEIFDVTADEISIEDLMTRVHPDDAERFRADRQGALDPTGEKPYLHHEFRVRRRDGTVRWVEGYGLAYFEGAGPERRVVSFGGTVQDITERKEREEKEHLLMREINHRAKNMLSVVDSIAHQTAIRNPEDFIARFSERIQALSANQDLLIRNEWNGVEIKDLVCAQLAHFADLIGPRIALRGPELRLNPASAQAIGLALHELATNAGKYGALSTDKGRVDIDWGIDGDTLTMSWTERDGPPVSAPKRRGFGTIVVETMVERSVNGTVDLDYAPSGLCWRLTCPAAGALEPGEREQV
jgi:PAS domain S-box-containing protein